jgi:hypothetical protein
MNLFTRNSPYYHLLKYLIFHLKHPVYLNNERKHTLGNPKTSIYLYAVLRTSRVGNTRNEHLETNAWKFSYVDNTCQAVYKIFRPPSCDTSQLCKELKTRTRGSPEVPPMSMDWSYSSKIEFVIEWWLGRGLRESISFPKPHGKKVIRNMQVFWYITPSLCFMNRAMWYHCATRRKVAGSIPDGVIGIFHWHYLSGRTMALGSTQPIGRMILKG